MNAAEDRRTVTDPVYGMTMPADAPRTAERDGETCRFCSDGCRAKFVADPDRYLGGADEPTEPNSCCHGGGSAPAPVSGCNSLWRRRWSCGAAGRSSCGGGSRS